MKPILRVRTSIPGPLCCVHSPANGLVILQELAAIEIEWDVPASCWRIMIDDSERSAVLLAPSLVIGQTDKQGLPLSAMWGVETHIHLTHTATRGLAGFSGYGLVDVRWSTREDCWTLSVDADGSSVVLHASQLSVARQMEGDMEVHF